MFDFIFNIIHGVTPLHELTFEWPWMFVLLVLPLILRNWTILSKNKSNPIRSNNEYTEQALRIPFMDELENPTEKSSQSNSKPTLKSQAKQYRLFAQLLLITSWVLLITAIAKPMWIGKITNLPISSRNIIVAVDLSGSMAKHDFTLKGKPVTRLDAIKKVAIDFIDKRVGDRIGLILFADHAYLQAPLTRDRQTVMRLLDEAELGLAGERTALGNAIGLAVKKVQEHEDQEHVLVLMTDGTATVGVSVEEAIRFATKVNLKIYTLGIGSIIPASSTPLSRNKRTNGLDEQTLKKIADKTGGLYFRATDVSELESIYQELDKLEPVVDTSQAWHPRKDLFHVPLLLAFLLLILQALILLAKKCNFSSWHYSQTGSTERTEFNKFKKNKPQLSQPYTRRQNT